MTDSEHLAQLVALLRVRPVLPDDFSIEEAVYIINEYAAWDETIAGYMKATGIEGLGDLEIERG